MIAQRPVDQPEPPTHVMGVARFERFFRLAAGLDVDKQDLKRFSEFVNRKIYDLLACAQESALRNGRTAIAPFDLPITKGLQESIGAFEAIDERIALQPILDHLTARPPLIPYTAETEQELPRIAGGLGVAFARTFKIVDPAVKHPAGEHWHRATQIFDLLL
jgi:hypothetical protein